MHQLRQTPSILTYNGAINSGSVLVVSDLHSLELVSDAKSQNNREPECSSLAMQVLPKVTDPFYRG